MDNLRKVIKNTSKSVAILQDLGGPKIRLGEFSTETVELKAGNKIIITTEKIVGTEKKVSISYKAFPKEVKKETKL